MINEHESRRLWLEQSIENQESQEDREGVCPAIPAQRDIKYDGQEETDEEGEPEASEDQCRVFSAKKGFSHGASYLRGMPFPASNPSSSQAAPGNQYTQCSLMAGC